MLDHLIILMPCSICIVWCYLLFTRRGDAQIRYSLCLLAAIAGAYFLLDSYVITPTTDYRTAVVINLLYAFVAPSLFPVMIILIRRMSGKTFSPTTTTLLFTPSLLIGSTLLIIYMTLGINVSASYLEAFDHAGGHPSGWNDDIYLLRDFVCIYIYNTAIIIWAAVTTFFCVKYLADQSFKAKDVVDFFYHGKPINTFYIICFSIINVIFLIIIRGLLGRAYIETHLGVRWTMSILMTFSIFNGMFTGYRFDGALIDIRHFRNSSIIDKELKAFRESQQRKNMAVAGIVRNEDALTRLRDLFVEYMDIDKPYLDPEMTLDDAASALSTNRTYLSSMLKNIMGVTFKTYINERRIQSVKETMTAHPGSNLREIAELTGFASDSQLIKKFSEIVGESPRSWLKKQHDEGRQG